MDVKNYIYLGREFMIGFCDSRKKFILLMLEGDTSADSRWFEKLEIDMNTAGSLASFIKEKRG